MSSSDPSGNQGGNSTQPTLYTSESLDAMELSEITALAETLGYTITETAKADVITEFLAEQDLKYQFTETQLNAMTISRIEDIATARGYTITQTLKADIIAEFLAQQM